MRILAIESSAVTASVAILEDDTLVAEYTINHKMTHSQTLLPMIDEIFSMVQLKPDDVDVIAVSKDRVHSQAKNWCGYRQGNCTCA